MTRFFNHKKSGASRKRSLKRVRKGLARRVQVMNLHCVCTVDTEAQRVLNIAVNPQCHSELNRKISNYLLGFDAQTQGIIVEAIALYWSGEAVTMTCLPAVDLTLLRFYREIDTLLSYAG